MKKIITIFALISVVAVYCQQVDKPVILSLATDKNKCLQKNDTLGLDIATYKEKPNQEWKIISSADSGYYYLKTGDNYYLRRNADTLAEHCSFSPENGATDEFKFKFEPLAENNWLLSCKAAPSSYLQPNNEDICLMPRVEGLGVEAFRIDTVPYRRPKPRYTHFDQSGCDVGILVDEKEIPVYGADATFYKGGGMYQAQLIVRLYTSADRKNRIDIYLFDDVLRIHRTKIYTLNTNQPNKKLLNVLVIKQNKIEQLLLGATCKLSSVSFRANTMELYLEKWTSAAPKSAKASVKQHTYDVAFKGEVRIQ